MPFQPVTVPLVKGQDSNSADLSSLSQAQDLLSATNVVFTRRGSIRGRPGTASKDGSVVMFDTGAATGTTSGSLSSPLTSYLPAGLHVAPDGTTYYQLHGRLLRQNTTGGWSDMGPCWSVRRDSHDVVRSGETSLSAGTYWSMDVGPNLAGQYVTRGGASGFAYYDSDGKLLGPITNSANYSDPQFPLVSVANNAVFWVGQGSDAGKVFAQVVSSFPTATQTQLATDANTAAPALTDCQRIWASYDGSNYWIAYVTSTTTTVNVIKWSGSGAVSTTQSYVFSGVVNSVCIDTSSADDRGVLLVTTSVAPLARSEVWTLSTSTSAAISQTFTPTDSAVQGAVCGIVNSTAYLAWCGQRALTNTTVDVASRSITAAVSVPLRAFKGYSGLTWQTLFPPMKFQGRPVMGVLSTAFGNSVGTLGIADSGTWLVVDIGYPTFTVNGGTSGGIAPVAAGDFGAVPVLARPGSACIRSDKALCFGVVEGISFVENSIGSVFEGDIPDVSVWRPIRLSPQAAPSVFVGTDLLLGGNVTYICDGRSCYESNWVEGQPVIFGANQVGGSMTASASFTFQAVWSYVDGKGRQTRSVASLPVTMSTTGANKQFALQVTAPQVSCKGAEFVKGATNSQGVWFVELYATSANPTANADLYLVDRVVHSGASGVAIMSVSTDPDPTAKPIYTFGNVLDDERAPADRGLAVVTDRLWAASENRLYASHLRQANVAPAWNTETLVVDVPPALGKVRSLSGMDEKLVVVCEAGVAVVTGPGYDEVGSGSGWSTPQRVYQVGAGGYGRSSTVIPDGVVWVGPDGLIYLLSRSLSGQCVGLPVQNAAETGTDLVYVPPVASLGWDTTTHPLLVYGTSNLKVLDLVTGQWCLWTGTTATSLAGGPGGLLASVSGSPYVVAFTASGGQDLGVNFAMDVKTAPQELGGEGNMVGWGRIRSVNPMFETLAAHTLRVQVFADEARQSICDKSFSLTTAAEAANWPNSRTPEARMTRERASFVEVELTATPAAAEWTSITLWVTGTPDRAPARSRS